MVNLSIIIPLYNKEKYIKNTIYSIINQNYTSYELLIVDDGSTDDSLSVVKTITDHRIRVIKKENGGVSSARNAGIEHAKYEWVFFLDADDSLMPNALKNMVSMIEKYPQEKFFSGHSLWEGNKKKNIKSTGKITRTKFPQFLIWTRIIDPAPRNIVVHKSLFKEYGMYDERMSFYEDWEVSIKMARYGRIVYSDFVLAKYTPDGNGLGSQKHPLAKEMAYYIPEMLSKEKVSLWEMALLYENIEQEISWWQGHQENIVYYREMQRKYFPFYHKWLHWLRQKFIKYKLM